MERRKAGSEREGIIIDRPDLMTTTRRYGESTTAAIAWVLWVFLTRPLLFIALWAFGARVFYVEMVKSVGWRNWEAFGKYLSVGWRNWEAFGKYFLAIIGICLLLLFWNRYNVMRFRGKERRRASKEVADVEMASFYRMSEQDVRHIKNWKTVNVQFLPGRKLLFGSGSADDALVIEGSHKFSRE
jgi:poly-beta-1,6-N-acetyl-D-glucosamine biosynthesis protein PgaD